MADQERAASPRSVTIWFEVEDFLQYFDGTAKAGGIQRVQMELFAAVQSLQFADTAIRYCRINRFSHRLESVDYQQIERTFREPPLVHAPWLDSRLRVSEVARRWLRDTAAMARRFCRRALRRFGGSSRPIAGSAPLRAGDILVCTGLAWMNRHYGELVADAKRDLGIRVVVLFHDIIPISHPQYSVIPRRFRRWADAMLRCANRLATQSLYSRGAVLAHAKEIGLDSAEVSVLRFGATFGAAAAMPSLRPGRLALPRPYVLFVSTIEVRKNHLFLVRTWKRLIERHGHAAVPALVFVGARGWLIEPLLAELSATRHLGGKVRIFSDLSDAELELCYRYCLFTAYPSFVEGWGLPVAESLQHGKLCVASNRSSLPEIGGDLVDYVDPEDHEASLAAFERAIFDPAYRTLREARIRREYHAPSWADCAQALVRLARSASENSDIVASPPSKVSIKPDTREPNTVSVEAAR